MAYKSYKRLTKYPGIWRVDGIGEVFPFEKSRPHLTVHFSGIKEDATSSPYHKDALNNKYLHFKAHPASITHFTVGSLWEKGKSIYIPETIGKRYKIDASRMKLFRLTDELWIKNQKLNTILPERFFMLGKNRKELANTFYALVPTVDNKLTQWLIIPASELFRFYVGTSYLLMSNAFSGTLRNLIDIKKCVYAADGPVLYRKRYIPRDDYLALFRYLSSECGKKALTCTHKHLSAVHANNASPDGDTRPLAIKACFPFDGYTTLTIAGKNIPLTPKDNEGKQEWAVFTMEIQHCNHPPDFTNPLVKDTYKTNKIITGSKPTKNHGSDDIPTRDEDDDPLIEDKPADKRIRRLAIHQYSDRFSAMRYLTFPRQHEYQEKDAPNITNHTDATDTLSTEEGSYSKDAEGNTGISSTDINLPDMSRSLTHFIEAMEHLKELIHTKKWTITTRRLSDSIVLKNVSISLFPLMESKRYTWHFINDNGTNRPRQVVIVEICLKKDKEYLYLLEMELKPNESGQCTALTYNNDLSNMKNTDFENLLELTTANNRWPLKNVHWKNDNHRFKAILFFKSKDVRRIGHPRPTKKTTDQDSAENNIFERTKPKKWAEMLLDKIKEEIPEITTNARAIKHE